MSFWTKTGLSRGGGTAGAWLCQGQWRWGGWDAGLQFSLAWKRTETQRERVRETLRVVCICLSKFPYFSPPHWPSSHTETILKMFQSILLWVLPEESGWTFLCAMGGRRNHPAGAPRGAAQPLMGGDKGSDVFLQQKMQLFLSATSLRTAVQTAPLPSPPPCPSGPRQPLTPELSCFVFFLVLTSSVF